MSSFQKVVGGALILGGLGFLAKTFIKSHSDDAPLHLSTRDKVIAIAIGAFGGFIVGLTSVGSGTFFGLAMLFAYPLTAPEDRRHRHVPRRRAALGRRASRTCSTATSTRTRWRGCSSARSPAC